MGYTGQDVAADSDVVCEKLSVSWVAAKDPAPIVGDSEYAHAQGEMMGHKMELKLLTVLGDGDCLYLAICVSVYLQLNYLFQEEYETILSDHLRKADEPVPIEFLNLKAMSGIGKQIVENTAVPGTKKSDLKHAAPFRALLAEHITSNQGKFISRGLQKHIGSCGGGTRSNAKKAPKKFFEPLIKSIKTAGTYWEEENGLVLSDFTPSLDVLLLYSPEAVSEESQSNTLHFFRNQHTQLISSDRVKKVCIVLHMINPGWRFHLGNDTQTGKRKRKCTERSTDENHYEPVMFDANPRFQLPGMDDETLAALTKPANARAGDF